MTSTKTKNVKQIRTHGAKTAAVIPRPTKGSPEVIIPAKKKPAP